MSLRDRRLGFRVPLQIFLTQYVRDRPVRALTTNVSDTGIFLQTVKMPWQPGRCHGATVALEFELPGTGETIWARGEICHADGEDPMVAGSGVRFTGIPTLHARLIRDYCVESRRARLGSMLSQLRRPGLPLPH